MFYRFRQNNSGGHFTENEEITASVYIEADNTYEANKIAENIGIYFDGCHSGIDCDCCGDRWYEADDYSAIKSKEEMIEYIGWNYKASWRKLKYAAIVHHKTYGIIRFFHIEGMKYSYGEPLPEPVAELIKNGVNRFYDPK